MTYRYLAEIPALQSAVRADKVAVLCEGRTLTYAELARKSEREAARLLALGVRAGDRVAHLGRTHETFYELLFGVAQVRACLTPINTRLAIPEIAFILEDCDTRLLLVSEEYREVATAAVALVDRPIRIVGLGEEIAADTPAPPAAAADYQPGDDFIQVYTSGTTGRPKGVRLTNANYIAYLEARGQIEGMSYQPDEAVLVTMPLFHVAGINISLTTLAAGGRLIVMPSFAAGEALRLIETEKVARTTLAPAMLTMCLRAPQIETTDLSSLKSVIYGASPIGEAMLSEATKRFGCGFVQVYGLTETAGAATYLPPAAHTPELLRSCGLPWPSLEMAVLGEAGDRLEPLAIGEIVIRGPLVMPGYWKRPEATAEAFTSSGWLRTGDAGYRNADGFYFICDRVKDMIVSGGENVYPAEVENAIMGCPGVADVAVIGVPDDRWGEAVKAIVVRDVGASLSPDGAEIIAWARKRIAGYKTPKSVDFVAVLPRNPSGKVLRRELRKPYWAGRDRQI
jgi:acyl-CoA synthetase (AMP-forming)/AMP-acid ligase II